MRSYQQLDYQEQQQKELSKPATATEKQKYYQQIEVQKKYCNFFL